MDFQDVGMCCLSAVLWILGPLALFGMFLLSFSQYYILVVAYVAWIVYDSGSKTQLRRRSEWFRNLRMWHYLWSYYPSKFVVSEPLDASKNYIFGLHPHGVIVQGGLNFCTNAGGFTEKFPGIAPHFLVHNLFFFFPFREIMIRLGFHSVNAGNFQHILSKPSGGNAVVVVPGGVREMLASCDGNKVELVLKTRKGFVKQAIKNGSSLVPVFTFGENNLYHHHPIAPGSLFDTLQKFFRRLLDFPVLNVSGRWCYLPLRRPLYTVVGTPIHTCKNTDPSQEEIDEVHRKYVNELMRVFETHKAEFGCSDQTIELI